MKKFSSRIASLSFIVALPDLARCVLKKKKKHTANNIKTESNFS